MCNCASHARDLSETQGGKYPAADHAPTCEDFKTEPFTRIGYDGTYCIMEAADAEDMLADSDTEYTIETVHLTRDQFERLDEFTGF